MREKSRFSLGLLIVAVTILIALMAWGTGLYIDWIWFKTQNYQNVFVTRIVSDIGLRILVGLIMFILLLVNLMFTRKSVLQAIESAKTCQPFKQDDQDDDDDVITINQSPFPDWRKQITPGRLTIIFVAISAVLGFLYSSSVAGEWTTVLKFFNQSSFGITDPIFNKDLSFYIFSLPLLHIIFTILASAIFLNITLVALVYLATGPARSGLTKIFSFPAAKYHLSVLAALFFLLKAWGYRLDQYELLFSSGGVIHGAGYTDIHATLLAYKVLLFLCLITAVIIIANIFLNRFRMTVYAIVGLFVTAMILGTVYPGVIQKFVVLPNEFNREAPYIANNIKFTQQAYNFDKIVEKDFPAGRTLQAQDIQENKNTIDNIRLWDWAPLQQTYSQLQEMRLYYEFKNIDIDRYKIDGEYRQVMMAVREMNQEQLAAQAQTWINQRLVYTHGYGIAMSPVNEVSGEGLPQFFLKDIPPVSSANIEVTRPEIYYGESEDGYVIVNTKTKEFNYPKGDGNAYSNYEGSGDVKVNSFFRKILLAFTLADYKLLLTSDISNDSQVLLYRNIKERVPKIAPFLSYDGDPYPVINNQGEIYWLWDAYTISNMYPYSEPFDNQGNNYIRNSVKVTMNAYSGDVKFYIADTEDPIIKAYAKIFPGMFKDLSEMPNDLIEHIRYPEDMFYIQSRLYTMYHMTDPQVFYNGEDRWILPTEKVGDEEKPMEPYYVITVLPGEEEPEFVQIIPFTPQNKKNMISWFAARSDGENYGKLLVYEFPKQELVYGPMQIEARIDQDTTISQQLSLWDQRGSNVIRGNLVVIPIKDSLIYVEPLYLQSEQSKMPELRRVIVAAGDKIVMEPTLEIAIQRIYGEDAISSKSPPQQGATPDAQPTEQQPTTGKTVRELASEANSVYEEAQDKLRAGDWAGYGQAIDQLKNILSQLQEQSDTI